MKAKYNTRLTADVLDKLDNITPGTMLYLREEPRFAVGSETAFVLEFDYDETVARFKVFYPITSKTYDGTLFINTFLDMFTTDPERAWRYEQEQ